MAKVAGSGQGRVRQYRTGRMVRCSDAGCQRACRFIGFGADVPTYNCGQAPLLAKTGRVGQQKQARR